MYCTVLLQLITSTTVRSLPADVVTHYQCGVSFLSTQNSNRRSEDAGQQNYTKYHTVQQRKKKSILSPAQLIFAE